MSFVTNPRSFCNRVRADCYNIVTVGSREKKSNVCLLEKARALSSRALICNTMNAYEIINREIADNCRFEVASCPKVRPERRKKEVKRKLNRELTAIGYSPFFLTFSGRPYIKTDDILVKPLTVAVFHS